jgi:hypothetical protein
MDEARERLMNWTVGADEVAPQLQGRGKEDWFKGANFQVLQTKAELRAAGFDQVLFGWKPHRPIIFPETRVRAVGSCFARYFILWLGDHGFNRSVPESPYNALVKFGFSFENVAVIAQQFRWAFGKFDSQNALWIAKDQEQVVPTEESRLLTRDALEQTEVLIITLGLSEVWHDRITGEPLWRALPISAYDPSRHGFTVLSVAETVSALEEIDAIRCEYLPRTKILYTVSPIRLRATYRPISAVTANSASKAILRAALDEFLRAHWGEVNENYLYFPSYEIVTELLAEPFCDDMRHLYPHIPDYLLSVFAKHYTALPMGEAGTELDRCGESELRRTIDHLETENLELQRVCDERLAVIQELDTASRERLTLVEELQRTCEERAKVIQVLENAARKRSEATKP